MLYSDSTSTVSNVVQGGVTSMVVLYLSEAVSIMIPFIILMGVLIVVDLYFGIEAARLRKKSDSSASPVRISTAIRKTVNKVFEYLCWIILAASLSVTFGKEWISFATLSVVFGNELFSVVDNYFYCHGKKIVGLKDFVLKVVGSKLDVDTSDVHIEEIDNEAQ